ncbi:MAG TPA: sulfotransferase [Steroidobacteraceae bacterium]|nr:sulfotransferase [Steroidobacteraceae bacterium]
MIEARRRPNLFVIGAMKSGTTSLHEYLNTHPQIAMSEWKEPAFFVEELTLRRGEDWYLTLFENDERYRYLGESSTHYTRLPVFQGVAERLHAFSPDARLIYIMRNPFDRVVSHYWHNTQIRDFKHGGGEPRSLLRAVKEDPQYLAFGDYATQLEPYINLFGREALYTLTFETLVQDPQRELDKIYQWLGLPTHPLGDQSAKAHNQRPQGITGAAGAGILYRIRFSNTWDRVASYFPIWMKEWAKRLAYRPVDGRQSQKELARLRAEIGDLQRRQIDRLRQLLNRDFPEWRIEI